MANYELHNFDRKGVFYNEALTDMDNAIKELAEGGSGGGLQLEQIGTTHTVKWDSKGGGQIRYFSIVGGLYLVSIEAGGTPINIADSNTKILIDDNPNILYDGDRLNGNFSNHQFGTGYEIGAAGETNRFKGMLVYENGKLYATLKDETNKNVTQLNGDFVFVGKLADNIT